MSKTIGKICASFVSLDTQKKTMTFQIQPETKFDVYELADEMSTLAFWGHPLELTIKRQYSKRPLEANGYCWILCKQIANAMNDEKVTKEEVYRKNVRETGICKILTLPHERVKDFQEEWEKRGRAWFVDVLDQTETKSILAAYYGSSHYNTWEMGRLIDNIIQDAKAVGVPVFLDDEVDRIKEQVGNG